jgi:hypothetical protein
MRQSRHRLKALCVMGSVLALMGCGGSDGDGDGDGGRSGGGTVSEAWAGFCTATFTEDTPIVDAFDEPMFTARVGEEFLMSDFDDSFGARAELLFLTTTGPDSFELKPNASSTWPFTSNCTIGAGVPYYTVFQDVTVFAEKELTTKLCSLSAGSALPAGAAGRGYALSSVVQGAAVYQLILGPFSAECGGVDRGYIRVPQTNSFGSTTYLVPVSGIIGPE